MAFVYYPTAEDAQKAIQAQAPFFRTFLTAFVGNRKVIEALDKLSAVTPVLIFSGVIRNYLIGEWASIRDLDIVLASPLTLDILRVLKNYQYRINSFKGVKVRIDGCSIDAWLLGNTWGIQHNKIKPTANALIKTAFFNFSAIVFDYNHQKFIFDDAFIDFLMTRKMEIVLPDNPNIPLCLFNIFYYHKTYGFGIGATVKDWIKKKYNGLVNFDMVQRKHLGYVAYSSQDIYRFYSQYI